MLPVSLVPLGYGRILVHVLDDLPPAYAGVICAEGNLALLRGVGNDAHFGAAEVVVEEILEPHTCDEQEVPRVGGAALHGVFVGSFRAGAAILGISALGERPSLVELLEKVVQREALGSAERLVILE